MKVKQVYKKALAFDGRVSFNIEVTVSVTYGTDTPLLQNYFMI